VKKSSLLALLNLSPEHFITSLLADRESILYIRNKLLNKAVEMSKKVAERNRNKGTKAAPFFLTEGKVGARVQRVLDQSFTNSGRALLFTLREWHS